MSRGSKLIIALLAILSSGSALAQSANLPGVAVSFGQGTNLVDTIEVLLLFTVLTLAPAIIILCTSFTRIVVVLSFMRQALGTQNMPPNQLLIGFAMFLSIFVMMPTGKSIYENTFKPYQAKQIDAMTALKGLETDLRGFMEKHVRKNDIGLFYDVTGELAPSDIKAVPTHYLIPAFIISERPSISTFTNPFGPSVWRSRFVTLTPAKAPKATRVIMTKTTNLLYIRYSFLVYRDN